MFIWYIFPVLVSCTKKNLATLDGQQKVQLLDTQASFDKGTTLLLRHLGSARLRRPLKVRVGIQKPVVTYDPCKFSVTLSDRLPNYFKISLLDNVYTFVKLLFDNFCFEIL
jgi:hypothetical protein